MDRYKEGKRDMRIKEMKGIINSFGDVLWTHLDNEVRQLKADNMRKYWSLEDVKRLPM